ncbi:hypothetical protein BV898_11517 [Hypsibius exemplaris]|uniref:Uncharacterized protein n=1 Tax=Hypsibius exemplaris TaxID=2072580 RepID=A0A1W0WGF6_HYPEX|nr:hypothetical protein BV898_11517 [Hypsibius exemplaris]
MLTIGQPAATIISHLRAGSSVAQIVALNQNLESYSSIRRVKFELAAGVEEKQRKKQKTTKEENRLENGRHDRPPLDPCDDFPHHPVLCRKMFRVLPKTPPNVMISARVLVKVALPSSF